jgi:hemerythrin-like metal-binding protein
MFEWNNSYSVGITSIDAQHQNLFAMGRELHTAMSNGQGKASLAKILDRLVQYTSVHFAHEERLMRLADYPELAEHTAEHALLTKKVAQFQKDFEAGRAVMTVQLLQFLKDWLHHHINGSDQKYTPHLKRVQ